MPPTGTQVSAEITDVADSVVSLVRTMQRARARFVDAAQDDVEWSAHLVLHLLGHQGPMRASDVAGCLRLDPSTVSRQVATLVREGYAERRSDPVDGRASILVPTTSGEDLLRRHDQRRLQHFDAVLAGWDDAQLRQFAALLRRFTTDFETGTDAAYAEAAHAPATEGIPSS